MDNQAWEELIRRLVREGVIYSPQVIGAMRQVSRGSFLPEDAKSYAAVDSPLPLGFGQTVSAPLG